MADLSVATIAALAAGGAILIAAFFAGLVSVITAWRTIVGKVTSIDAHVNSEKSEAQGRENTLKSENRLLREMLTESKQTAELLAQAALMSSAAAPSLASPPAPDGTAVKHLKNIDTQPAEVAENTKSVEAKVDSLKDQA